MTFLDWTRELAGWLLVLAALYFLRIALTFIMDLETPRIVEAMVATIAGLGIMRAGVALIRLSSSMRILKANERTQQT